MEEREYNMQHSQEKIPAMDKNLRFYLKKELRGYSIDENPEDVIRKIEEAENENPPNPRGALMGLLENTFREKTLLFVNRLMGYQKKMCRDGAGCRRLGCYFKHPSTNENMMEIEESPMQRRESRYAGSGEDRHMNVKSLLDKQKRLLEILVKRNDLPVEVMSTLEQIRRITNRIKPNSIMQGGGNESITSRFIISNRKDWMTQEHLSTYPGVVSVSADGIVECASPEASAQVAKMLLKIDHTAKPTWI